MATTVKLENIRYWVTAIGGDVGASIARNIRDKAPMAFILGTDLKPYVQGRDAVDEVIVIKRADSKDYLKEVLEIIDAKQINCIIPAHDSEISFFANKRDLFEEKGVKVLVHSKEFLDICQSKYKTANWLKEIGISTPTTCYYGELDIDISYPAIVKPDRGCGSHGIFTVNSKDELVRYNLESDMVIQDKVGTDEEEYTLAIYYSGREYNYLCYRRTLGFGGMSVFVETISFDWLDKMVSDLCQVNKFIGCINVQFRIENNKYYIFEINPRISSTARFRHMMKFEDVIWWVCDIFGIKYEFSKIEDGLIGVKTTGEIIY